MTLDDILTLAKAGFTAQQIAAMTALAKAGFTAQQIAAMTAPAQPEAAPEPAPIPDPTPTEPASDPTPAPEVMPDLMDAINRRLDDFMNTFRGQLNPSISDVKPLSVDDVIAKILKED